MDDRLRSALSYEAVARYWIEESERDFTDPDNEFYASQALRYALEAKKLRQEVAEETHKKWMDKHRAGLERAKDIAWITLFIFGILLVIYGIIRLAI